MAPFVEEILHLTGLKQQRYTINRLRGARTKVQLDDHNWELVGGMSFEHSVLCVPTAANGVVTILKEEVHFSSTQGCSYTLTGHTFAWKVVTHIKYSCPHV